LFWRAGCAAAGVAAEPPEQRLKALRPSVALHATSVVIDVIGPARLARVEGRWRRFSDSCRQFVTTR